MAKYLHGYADLNTQYIFKVRVFESPEDSIDDRGTLQELIERQFLLASLFTTKSGDVDQCLLYEPLEMKLTIGWGYYELRLAED